MRLFVLIVMIALLPMRGWAGEAMATQMASANATKSGAGGAHKTYDSAAFGLNSEHSAHVRVAADCADHLVSQVAFASGAESSEGEGSQSESSQGEVCNTCQACHTVALSGQVSIDSFVFDTPLPPLGTAIQFTSADAALGQKPPIF